MNTVPKTEDEELRAMYAEIAAEIDAAMAKSLGVDEAEWKEMWNKLEDAS